MKACVGLCSRVHVCANHCITLSACLCVSVCTVSMLSCAWKLTRAVACWLLYILSNPAAWNSHHVWTEELFCWKHRPYYRITDHHSQIWNSSSCICMKKLCSCVCLCSCNLPFVRLPCRAMFQCRWNPLDWCAASSAVTTTTTTTHVCAHTCAKSQLVCMCVHLYKTDCVREADYEQSHVKMNFRHQLSVARIKVGHKLSDWSPSSSRSSSLCLSLPGMHFAVKQAETSFCLSPSSSFSYDSFMHVRDP